MRFFLLQNAIKIESTNCQIVFRPTYGINEIFGCYLGSVP